MGASRAMSSTQMWVVVTTSRSEQFLLLFAAQTEAWISQPVACLGPGAALKYTSPAQAV